VIGRSSALAITRLPTPLFWGVAMAFFSLVPVVGSGLIFVPAALWLGFTGHWGRPFFLLAICAGVSTIVDNVLRPLLLGGRSELSGLVIFISVVGGVSLFGMLGLVAGTNPCSHGGRSPGGIHGAAGSPPITAR